MLLDIQGDINVIKNTMNELKKLSDEEKINLPRDVYLRNIFCHDCSLKKTCGNAPCENYEYWKEGYEKGLTEGRKEKCLEQNKDGTIRPCEVMKENAELKKEISVLLSCSNCPDNKGGYICEKEYNDKCLAQKIEYIKELKEDNKDLCDSLDIMNNRESELLEQIEKMKCCGNCIHFMYGYCMTDKSCHINNEYKEWKLAE